MDRSIHPGGIAEVTKSEMPRGRRENGDAAEVVASESRSQTGARAEISIKNLDLPVFLMNLPLSLSAEEPNNILMRGMTNAERRIDKRKAISQFLELYRFLSERSIVYLLPSAPALQDQTYVANLGAVIPHLHDEVVVVSRFRSRPRLGESAVALDFFKLLNFRVHMPPPFFDGSEPLYFEGEADLKYIHGNVYIGAHGLRTSRKALEWLSSTFDMRVIGYPIVDDHLYHLDCCVLLLDGENIVLSRKRTDPETLRLLQKECNIVDVSLENVRSGLTNSLIVGDHLLCDSPIDEIGKHHPHYPSEKRKIARLERICASHQLQLRMFNLSEFLKSGAALSCLIMRLNHQRQKMAS